MITITIHHTHDPEVVADTLAAHPDFVFDFSCPPTATKITGERRSIAEFLLDYYHWERNDVLMNHPEVTDADLDLV